MSKIASVVLFLTPLALLAASSPATADTEYGRIPAYFEWNAGQASENTLFTARGTGYSLALKKNGASLSLAASRDGAQLGLELLNANDRTTVRAEEPLAGRSNYYIGNDPKYWMTGVPQFGRVRYKDVYPGVDLVWRSTGQQLEYDLVVRPSGDPGRVRFRLTGGGKPALTAEGDLVVGVGRGELRQRRPVLYQEENGARVPIEGGYVLLPSGAVRIRTARYDRRKPLVIDPVLTWATFVSATGSTTAHGIAVDATGATYLIGDTDSNSFPGFPGPPAKYPQNIFVAKLNPQGTGLVYATYLGTSSVSFSFGRGIAVDPSGNAYITGSAAGDFPVTPGAAQTSLPAGAAVVVKLDPTGQIAYSTLLGGSGPDSNHGYQAGLAIAVDATGAAYVAGMTYATDFPTTPNAYLRTDPSQTGTGFVTKVNPSGSAFVYSTYFGGSWEDHPNVITVNAAGEAWIGGFTGSVDLPVTPGAFQPVAPNAQGYGAGFVSHLSADGSSLLYSTYLGGTWSGSGSDQVFALALDSSGNVYAGGQASTNFPTTPNAFQTKGRAAFSPSSAPMARPRCTPPTSAPGPA